MYMMVIPYPYNMQGQNNVYMYFYFKILNHIGNIIWFGFRYVDLWSYVVLFNFDMFFSVCPMFLPLVYICLEWVLTSS